MKTLYISVLFLCTYFTAFAQTNIVRQYTEANTATKAVRFQDNSYVMLTQINNGQESALLKTDCHGNTDTTILLSNLGFSNIVATDFYHNPLNDSLLVVAHCTTCIANDSTTKLVFLPFDAQLSINPNSIVTHQASTDTNGYHPIYNHQLVRHSSDNHYYLFTTQNYQTAYQPQDMILRQFDTQLNMVDSVLIDLSVWDSVVDIEPTNNGFYLLTKFVPCVSCDETRVLKTDMQANIIWTTTIQTGAAGSFRASAGDNALAPMSNGNLLVGGSIPTSTNDNAIVELSGSTGAVLDTLIWGDIYSSLGTTAEENIKDLLFVPSSNQLWVLSEYVYLGAALDSRIYRFNYPNLDPANFQTLPLPSGASGWNQARYMNLNNNNGSEYLVVGSLTATTPSKAYLFANSLLSAPNITILGDANLCAGEQSVLQVPNTYDAYLWSNGNTTNSLTVVTNPNITNITTTNYNLQVQQGNCWLTTNTVAVQTTPLPTINLTGATDFCAGQSIVVTATGGSSYQWSNGSSTAQISISTAGTYTVTVTNSAGCSNTLQLNVSQNPAPDATIIGDNSFCTGQSTTLLAAGGNSYQWNNGSNVAEIDINEAGTYTVTVTNNVGCTNVEQIAVSETPLPNVAITYTQTADNTFTFSNASTNYTQITADYGDGEITTLPANTTTFTHTYNTPNTYTVTITLENADGCSVQQTFMLDSWAVGTFNNSKNPNKLHIYPNPATSQDLVRINFSIDSPLTAHLAITDLAGRVLQNNKLDFLTNNFEFSANTLPSGMYLAFLQTANTHIATTKFVIE